MANSQLSLGNGHGGARANSGPKPSWFKEEMEELIKTLSPDFAQFAKDVFQNAEIEPRVTKQGLIYTHASVHDKTVLFATIAKLSGLFGNSDESPLRAPMQKLIDQVQAIKLMQELNYGPKPAGSGNGHAPVVGNGHPSPPADSSPA